jgi:hypothetical protein
MKNNNELDQIVESFLSPAPVKESMGLKELFALFEEMQKINEVTTVGILPTVSASEKQYEQEEQSITRFYETLQDVLGETLQSVQGQLSPVKLLQLIKNVDYIKKQQVTSSELSKSFATILFVTSLHKMIEDTVPDLPSVAGFFFEKFISFIFMGKPSTLNKERFPIFDLYIPDTDEYVSLKLKSEFKIDGSISNMYKFLTNTTEDFVPININNNLDPVDEQGKVINIARNLTYIIGLKHPHEIEFYSYTFNLKQFLLLMGKQNIEKYNSYVTRTQTLDNLKMRDSQVKAQIDTMLGAPNEDQEELARLQNQRFDILDSINQLSNMSAYTKFTFYKKGFEANSIQNTLKGEKLSISAEDKKKIIDNNQNTFNKNIKDIIEQSNLVYYKVNNFLLSNGENVQEAYDSVKSLETSLKEYLPSKKTNLKK